MHKNFLVGISVLAVAGLILAYFLQMPHTLPGAVERPVRDAKATNTQVYESSAYGLSFSYPAGYYLKEHEAPAERPQLSLVIVEDSEENRDLMEGRSSELRDGPTAITIDVYPNPDRLPAEDWVRADMNWTVRTSEAAPIGRGSITGVTYSWSGLYAGKSIVVTQGMRTYAFSVTWLTPADPILSAFDRVLASVYLEP